MLGATLALLRYVASLVFGLPFALRSLERLIDVVQATRREFGAIGKEGLELIGGPALDEADRREIQLRRFRTQAGRGARETAYYQRSFEQLGLDPGKLRYEDIARLPLTPKEAVRGGSEAFVRRSARPSFRTTTTGTTGVPTGIYFSDHELRTYAALSSISLLLSSQITPEDVVQISAGTSASLANQTTATAARRIGALVYWGPVAEPSYTLARLAERRELPDRKPRTSVMSVHPSYLGELVEYGLGQGYGPADFGLERVIVGGEIVSAGLLSRSQQLFGPIAFLQGYAMTETYPLSASLCPEGHLHFDPSQGLVEVLGLEADAPAQAGEAGRLIATPFPPYRESSVLLRYDTEDVVRQPVGPLGCSQRNLPATSNILGKLRLSVRHELGWTFPREVLEALEAVEAVPLPARCGFWATPGGVVVEAVARQDGPATRREIEQRLEEQGVPLRELRLVDDRRLLQRPLPLRCDLKEQVFHPSAAAEAARAGGRAVD